MKKSAPPQMTGCYWEGKYDQTRIKRNYLILDDYIHGVSTLIGRDTFIKYLKKIEGRVIYCEDLSYRLMAYDGIKMSYCPSMVAMYGYGTGVSTAGSSKWESRMQSDRKAANRIIESSFKADEKYNKLLKQAFEERYSGDRKVMKKFFMKHPLLLFAKLKMEWSPRYSPLEFDEAFADKLFGTDGEV